MNIGDLYSNDRREYTLEMNIPEGAGTFCGCARVLKSTANRKSRRYRDFSVDVRYTTTRRSC